MSNSQFDTSFLENKSRIGLNKNSKCRGCLREESDMKPLFLIYENTATLAKLIEDSLGYVMSEEGEFSKNLCKECTRIIVDFVGFKTTFQRSTEYFQSLSILHDKSQNINELNAKNVNTESEIYSIDIKDEKLLKSVPESPKNDSNPFDTEKSDDYFDTKEIKKLNCKFYYNSFKSRVQLHKHENIVHGKRPRKTLKRKEFLTDSNSRKSCKVCKHEFSAEGFDLHFESHKRHVCNTCGHRFIRKTDLNDHKETHLDVCKYECKDCGKTFKVRTTLNKHKRIHTNPREEICDVCGQRFNTRDTLKTHYKLKHVKSKDFQCYLCGLAFTLKSTLEKHIERHNPDRQRIHSCNLCNASYINKYNLTRHHIVKHTPFENRPTCQYCGKGYVKKIDLTKHLKRHHANENGQMQ